MKNQLLGFTSALLLTFMLLLSGCAKDEMAPNSHDLDLQAKVLSTPGATTQSCCTVGPGHLPWCSWRSAIESVLNCCHTETLNSPPCFWAPLAPLETYTFQVGSDITLPATGAYVDSKILDMAATADANRPGFLYLIIGYDVTNLGTYNGICTLQIVVTYRKKICYFQ